jgi:hypothetical protein
MVNAEYGKHIQQGTDQGGQNKFKIVLSRFDQNLPSERIKIYYCRQECQSTAL